MFSIPIAKKIISKIDGNTATSEEKSALFLDNSLLQISEKFLKKIGTQSFWVPTSEILVLTTTLHRAGLPDLYGWQAPPWKISFRL